MLPGQLSLNMPHHLWQLVPLPHGIPVLLLPQHAIQRIPLTRTRHRGGIWPRTYSHCFLQLDHWVQKGLVVPWQFLFCDANHDDCWIRGYWVYSYAWEDIQDVVYDCWYSVVDNLQFVDYRMVCQWDVEHLETERAWTYDSKVADEVEHQGGFEAVSESAGRLCLHWEVATWVGIHATAALWNGGPRLEEYLESVAEQIATVAGWVPQVFRVNDASV